MEQIRDYRMDNAKAVLIILVVVGHFLLPIKGNARVCTSLFFFIYTFHMVAFTFLSGIFAQNMYKKQGGKKVYRWKQWLKILWLYIVYEFVTFFSEIPAYGRTKNLPDLLRENGAPWYLMALLIWYLFIPLFSYAKGRYISIIKGKRIPVSLLVWLCILTMSLITGYLKGVEDFLSIDRAIAFAPCFFAGYFVELKGMRRFMNSGEESVESGIQDVGRGSHHGSALMTLSRSIFEKRFSSLFLLKLIFMVMGLISGVLILLHAFDLFYPYRYVVYGVWYEEMHIGNFAVDYPDAVYIAPWILRLIWYIMAGSLTALLLRLMPDRRIPVITDMGQRTLQIYILHRPVRDLMLAAGIITSVNSDNMVQLSLLCGLATVLAVFLSSGMFKALFDVLLFPFRKVGN